jgi:glycine betaine/proline transport system substrate-binding protein
MAHGYRPLAFVAAVAVSAVLIFAACSGAEKDAGTEESAGRTAGAGQTLQLVYPEWSSEIASAHLMQAVLQERLGYTVRLVPVPVEEMWRRVAEGEADVLAGAWLPMTHEKYYERYADRLDDLGPNMTGATIGLVVPTVIPGRQTGDTGKTGRELVTIRSIPEMRETADRFNGRIIGIESGSGVVSRTSKAMEAYDLRQSYYLVETDEEGMLERVTDAVSRKRWIVFTGWKPHWVFEHFNLRFLDDPKNIYGGEESIHTMVRRGLAEEMPRAHEVLSRISYSPEDLERLMRWIHNSEETPYEQALRWIRVHRETVNAWVRSGE